MLRPGTQADGAAGGGSATRNQPLRPGTGADGGGEGELRDEGIAARRREGPGNGADLASEKERAARVGASRKAALVVTINAVVVVVVVVVGISSSSSGSTCGSSSGSSSGSTSREE